MGEGIVFRFENVAAENRDGRHETCAFSHPNSNHVKRQRLSALAFFPPQIAAAVVVCMHV